MCIRDRGIAITSYQGGHVEFFKYMIDLLRAGGGQNIKVFGGGGGVIVPSEIKELHDYGVTRLYAPEDGQSMGLQGMINDLVAQSDVDLTTLAPQTPEAVSYTHLDVYKRQSTSAASSSSSAAFGRSRVPDW